MASGTYERKEFVGGAPATTVTGALSDSATSLAVASVTGWPDADPSPFVAVIDRGTPTEEKILVRSRTSTTFTVVVRGYDDTVPLAHSDGAAIEHALDASTIDQANRLANLLTAKGQIIASNGTNPVSVTAAAMDGSADGHALLVNPATATGVSFGRPVHLVVDSATPDVDAVPRLWFDTTIGVIRSSDGSSWIVPASIPFFASAGARTSVLGGDPLPGTASIVGTGGSLTFEVYDGTTWVGISRRDEAIPKFANDAARNAFYTAPANGDHAYVTDSSQLQEYRSGEWVILNQKVTISASPPASPHTNDIWLQPVS